MKKLSYGVRLQQTSWLFSVGIGQFKPLWSPKRVKFFPDRETPAQSELEGTAQYEGTAHYEGCLKDPLEGFGQWLEYFVLFKEKQIPSCIFFGFFDTTTTRGSLLVRLLNLYIFLTASDKCCHIKMSKLPLYTTLHYYTLKPPNIFCMGWAHVFLIDEKCCYANQEKLPS